MDTESTSNPVPPPDPAPEHSSVKGAESGRTRTGKVARLKKAVRDKLNFMILDGVPFAEIITSLGLAEKGITQQNITNWVAGGYKDWLKEQRDLEQTRVKQEVAIDLACPEGGTRIHQATLQLSATGLSEMVRKLDYSDFQDLLREDPRQLIPFLNALARISDAQIKCERFLQESYSEESPAQPPQNGLRPETRRAMEQEMNLM